MGNLTKKFDEFSILDPTRTQKRLKHFESYLDKVISSHSDSKTPGVHVNHQVWFQYGLKNLASTYQESMTILMQSDLEIPLTDAQQDLVVSSTVDGNTMHRLGVRVLSKVWFSSVCWGNCRSMSTPYSPSRKKALMRSFRMPLWQNQELIAPFDMLILMYSCSSNLHCLPP